MTAAVVTGIGVVAPNGVGTENYWQSVLAGRSGVAPLTRFDAAGYPVRVAGEVTEFDAAEHVPSRLRVQTDRWTQLAFHAADMALTDAGADPSGLPEYDMAVLTSSSSGGTEFGQHEIERLWSRGSRYVTAYQSIAWFYAATTGQLSIRHGMRGPCGVVCTEQAGGLDATGRTRRLLADGGARFVLTGGTDASLCPYGVTAQAANGLLSDSDDPDRAFQPFAATAGGYIPGEGGAILVAESADMAEARGTERIYGRITGYAATFDPRPGGQDPDGGSRLRQAAEQALADAGSEPAEIDVVFADASGDPERDRLESMALNRLFGPRGVPVTAPKTMTGRLYGGGAALDVATALLAIRDGVIPPTINVPALAPGCDLDLVRDEPRPASLRNALILARGHGGFNAALVISRAH
ncbi:ketosynthase chain-length factor [Streptomyces winkii]|uniref:ketosynthase chain-length factor n=1 Tax=Streptomyces winkii TaxID=3051178 RepID=UPI0028D7C8F5|nr:ketosynthase chain-length factor [Streptomyces sp. DSM 40971]